MIFELQIVFSFSDFFGLLDKLAGRDLRLNIVLVKGYRLPYINSGLKLEFASSLGITPVLSVLQ